MSSILSITLTITKIIRSKSSFKKAKCFSLQNFFRTKKILQKQQNGFFVLESSLHDILSFLDSKVFFLGFLILLKKDKYLFVDPFEISKQPIFVSHNKIKFVFFNLHIQYSSAFITKGCFYQLQFFYTIYRFYDIVRCAIGLHSQTAVDMCQCVYLFRKTFF